MTFVHLHVHSEYSLLDGFSNIKKLVQRAKELNMPALALTDHGGMYGVIEFYNAATKAGIKPIIGLEAYLAARSMVEHEPQVDKKSTHLLLLAENETGYKNLLKIASAAQLEGFYYYPRIDHEFLAKHAEGLIYTSGCMSAEVPRLILQGNPEAAQRKLDWYYEVFGPDRFFIELQQHDVKELAFVNKTLLEMNKRYQARLVATNDVHYIHPQDARLQDILLAIQTGCVLSDPKRIRMSDSTYYLRTPQEMATLFAEFPDALNNTLLIAERCNLDLSPKGYHLPMFEVPEGHTPQSYLRMLCEQGVQRRYGARSQDPEVRQRLEYELKVIHQMGFDTYFLIVWDLCRYAREQGIWYNARGSAAGSIVAYCLGITMVDPLKHGLIFERFLNPGRTSMPDIDLDFRDDMRTKMLEYAVKKFGQDKVAQIITFGTLGARAAIRDVGRVMDIPLSEVDRAAKLIPNIPGKPMTIAQALEEVPEFRKLYESTSYYRELIDTASQMEGVVRNAGTHAAGVIITDKPIIEYIPLHRPTGNTEDTPVKIVTQFEMSTLESLGLLKVDFLGLATLTIMAKACELIYQRHGVKFNLYNIPTNDPATYELLGRGETAGVFQVEGTGMRRYLMQMKPKSLENIIAMVALFRPGPMQFIPSYINRMHGKEPITYRHPALEPILKETYGITVYQEQIMYTAMQLAGYTASEADNLRKGVAKKKAEVLHKERQKFVEGAKSRGISEEVAHQIFDDWEDFARYGFAKGHAADYGVIAVQTAYLKAHYPVEYMTALLSVNQNDIKKIALYVADCRRMGIAIEPPDVNASGLDFTIEDRPDGTSAIRFGLGAIKNVGHGPVEAILKARGDTPFADINDFARRVDLRHVGKRPLECLVRVGALDRFAPRSALLQCLDAILSVSAAHFRAAEMGQISLFGPHTGVMEQITLPKVDEDSEAVRRQQLNWERELLGLYVSDHPLNAVIDQVSEFVTHFSGQLTEEVANEKVRVAGMITSVRPHQSKGGKSMGYVTLEDLQGTIELVLFPRLWEEHSSLLQLDQIIMVEGRLDAEGATPKVLVDKIIPLHPSTLQREGEPVMDGFVAQEQSRLVPNGFEQDLSNGWEVEETSADFPASARQDYLPTEERDSAVPLATNHHEAAVDWNEQNEWEEDVEIEDDVYAAELAEPSEKVSEETSSLPSDWNIASAVIAAAAEPEVSKAMASTVDTNQSPKKDDEDGTAQQLSANATAFISAEPDQVEQHIAPAAFPPYILPPASLRESEDVRMITIVLRPSGDNLRDNVRLRQIYGTLITYPGKDRFAFQVFEGGRGYRIEFPNFTTSLCPELLERLKQLVPPENLRIEPLTFQ